MHALTRLDCLIQVVSEMADRTDYPARDFTIANPDGNHGTFATFAG